MALLVVASAEGSLEERVVALGSHPSRWVPGTGRPPLGEVGLSSERSAQTFPFASRGPAFKQPVQRRVYTVKQHISVSKHSPYAIRALRVSAPIRSGSAKPRADCPRVRATGGAEACP